MTPPEIASRSKLTEETVRRHTRGLYVKLGEFLKRYLPELGVILGGEPKKFGVTYKGETKPLKGEERLKRGRNRGDDGECSNLAGNLGLA